MEIMERGRVSLDMRWLILSEYRNKLSQTGQPGVGDQFYKWVLTNQANATRCKLVPITPTESDPTDFEEFPNHPALRGFDPSDRKFVAVAAADDESPAILEASDSKWWGWRHALAQCGIQVEFLCPGEIQRKFQEKMGADGD